MHDLKRAASKFLAEIIREPFVFFDCENLRASRERQFTQRAQPWADLDDEIFRADVRLINDPSREILVVQKILAETFDR